MRNPRKMKASPWATLPPGGLSQQYGAVQEKSLHPSPLATTCSQIEWELRVTY